MLSAPHLLAYSTAKFAAVGFTEGLAASLAGSGVTASVVAPGLMRTGSHAAESSTVTVSASTPGSRPPHRCPS